MLLIDDYADERYPNMSHVVTYPEEGELGFSASNISTGYDFGSGKVLAKFKFEVLDNNLPTINTKINYLIEFFGADIIYEGIVYGDVETSSFITVDTLAETTTTAPIVTEPKEDPTLPVDTDGKIYFEVPVYWRYYSNIYCHIWVYGGDSLATWQSKKEKCTCVSGRLYEYDPSKVGGLEEGVYYGVIFSCDIGLTTYDTLMTTDCFGDTLYPEGTIYEDPNDCTKSCIVTFWKNQDSAVYGPVRQITSIGNVIGTCIPSGVTAEDLFERFIINNIEKAREESGKNDQELIDDIIRDLPLTVESAKKVINDSGIEIAWDESLFVPGESVPETEPVVPQETVIHTIPEPIDGIYYDVEDGEAIVTGWEDDFEDLIIPDNVNGSTVVAIGKYAYSWESAIKSIVIPDTVTTIGEGAFFAATKLEHIDLSDSITKIGMDAFYKTGCYKNPDYWTDGVFYINTALIDVDFENFEGSCTVKDGTTVIADKAFFMNRNVATDIIVPKSVKAIGDYAFGFYNADDGNFKGHDEVKIDGFTVYGYTGTAAEKYAQEYGLKFVAVDTLETGDVNGDNKLNIKDATTIQKYSAKMIKFNEVQISFADFNGDLKVNVKDATQIQKKIAGLI